MKKKIITSALICAVCLLFTSCGVDVVGSVDKLMRPPKLNGESSYLQQAFEEAVGKSETRVMKTPISGDNRSSYLLYDLDGDGLQEALVFYCDPNVSEYANAFFLKLVDGKWTPVSTVKGTGDEIYEVGFADINGDKKFEIIISWTTFGDAGIVLPDIGAVNKRVSSVYSYDGSSVTLIHSEPFSEMLVSDLDNDNSDELFFVNIDFSAQESKTTGKIISFNKDYSILENKSFTMSSFINIFNIVTDTFSASEGNHTRIYVDGGISETGIVTEIIDVLHSALEIKLPLYELNAFGQSPTIRDIRALSRDIDNDGIVEIPTLEILPGSVNITSESDVRIPLNLTVWSEFKNNKFIEKNKSIINGTYGYMFCFPEDWLGKVTAVYNAKNAALTFYKTDSNLTIGDEMFSLRAFSRLKWAENTFGYTKFGESGAFVYGYIIDDNYRQQISPDIISDNFIIAS